jgi:hypothetical protein
LGGLQCEKPTPPDDGPTTIYLNQEVVGVTDAWFKIIFMDATKPRSFTLKRDGQIVMHHHAQLSTLDTTILDDNLLPNRSYTYKTYRLNGNIPIDSSSALTITTMDTTNHNFQYETYLLGDGENSILKDVVIINDTCIWAVGEIYKKDSTGQFEPIPYGAVKWNGNKWEYKILPAQVPTNYTSYLIPNAIFEFSPNDMWVVSGGIHRFNGTNITQSFWINYFDGSPNPILDPGQSAETIWGTSSSDLYIAGMQGAIAHYDGNVWKKIESGTNSNIWDIWGIKNPNNNQSEIYCGITGMSVGVGNKILKITNGNGVDSINWRDDKEVCSVWTKDGRIFYAAAGGGVFDNIKGYWRENDIGANYSINYIRGTEINDIFVLGLFGLIVHYNGINWKKIYENSNDSFTSIYITEHIIVAVGYRNSRGLAIICKRN